MTELEKVEKLREKANVTYAEAKEALDNANGDLLGALIYLEGKGKAKAPEQGGFYTSSQQGANEEKSEHQHTTSEKKASSGFADTMKRIGRFCRDIITKCNRNYLEATKDGETILSLPLTAVIILLLFLACVFIPLFIISLFFGVRYKVRGREMGKDAVNKVMDGAADVADDIKRSFI